VLFIRQDLTNVDRIVVFLLDHPSVLFEVSPIIYLLSWGGGNQYCAQAASSQRVPSARSQGDFAGAMGLRWHLRWNGASDAALHVCVIADLVHENERRVACFSALRKQASFQEDGFVVQCF
jgi:hypothetical protein